MLTDQEIINFIKIRRVPIYEEVAKNISFQGTGAELGAGLSWFSSLVSREPGVETIYAVEIDPKRIDLAKKIILNNFGAKKEKIVFLYGDYHELPMSDKSLDFVLVDAALHHTKDLVGLLKEARRVLKDGGIFCAIREPILPRFWPLRAYQQLTFGWKQKLRGDIEKNYSMENWKDNFKKAGFELEIKEYFIDTILKEKIIKKLRIFNGILFSRYFFIAK